MTNPGDMHLISVSGGKDSTALALLAIERGVEPVRFVFADTGHEHAQTYDYVQYLDGEFRERCGQGIEIVRADFSAQIERKRERVQTVWREEGVPEDRIERALAVLHPTGSPFLDLCLWKGRFPSTRARFCTQELKRRPMDALAQDLIAEHGTVWSWQGVRADESPSRAKLSEAEDMGGYGLWAYRPLLQWSAADVFAFHTKYGLLWNPLYEQGMGRVGCMPCIHAGKGELREIAQRFPEEIERVAEWERLVGEASKRGVATFFSADKTPGHTRGTVADDPQAAYGIQTVIEWSLTGRGGRQFDLLHVGAANDEPACSSVYGLCE
jgi:3'-phosphoadenosine 5'-phosphosulfate sulfotransferase (PAPS reductase)/FAD synthetase